MQSQQQPFLVQKQSLPIDELARIVNRDETNIENVLKIKSPHCVMYLNLDIDSETSGAQVFLVGVFYHYSSIKLLNLEGVSDTLLEFLCKSLICTLCVHLSLLFNHLQSK